MKYHIHSEQFDGALHAACFSFPHDPFPGEPLSNYILKSSEEFSKIPAKDRCKYCENEEFPNGISE